MKYLRVCSIAQLCLILFDPLDYSPPGSPVHEFSKQEYRSGLPFPYSGYIFLTQGSNLNLLHWQADSLPMNPLKKKKHTYLVSKCFLCTYDVPGNYFRHLSPVNEHNRDFYLHGA